MPYFSIVIPVYNKENFISKTIESVLNQNFTDYELIIVNDGSTDQSEAEILAFKDNRIQYFSKKNEGVAFSRNFGIEKATADYICFLDADDYWYPNFLETIHRYSLELPEQKVFAAAEAHYREKNIRIAHTVLPVVEQVYLNESNQFEFNHES
jgi:glycosyltransferase involved in cell wall biosynthesis